MYLWLHCAYFEQLAAHQNAWEVAEHDEKIERGEEKESKKVARDYVKGLQEQHHMRGYSESGVRSILRNAILPPSRASTALSNATAPFISIKGEGIMSANLFVIMSSFLQMQCLVAAMTRPSSGVFRATLSVGRCLPCCDVILVVSRRWPLGCMEDSCLGLYVRTFGWTYY